MITKEQAVNGLLNYFDAEVIPLLPTSGKWAAGTVMILMGSKAGDVVDDLFKNPIVRSTGIMDDAGMIDADLLIAALKRSADKYGKMEIVIPIVGTMKFSSADVDALGRHMRGM